MKLFKEKKNIPNEDIAVIAIIDGLENMHESFWKLFDEIDRD